LKLLLIRLREIGDVVFTTPAVRALRERFPDAHLSYLVEPPAAPIVIGSPHLDNVIVAPRAPGIGGVRAEAALIRSLRRERFDVAIDFHGGPRASLLAWLSGAPRRIGYTVAGRGWMYTERVHRPRGLRPRHSVLNQWDLLAPLGIEPPSPASHPVEMAVDPVAVAATRRRLLAAGADTPDVIVMHVSAGNPFRRWPVESFAAVAAGLVSARPGFRVVVTSGPSEIGARSEVIGNARERLPGSARTRVIDCGEFSLAELRALVDHAALFIGGDSGPVHIAATSGVPIVTLYGPTLPARSAPWRGGGTAVAVETLDLPCRPCDQRSCAPGDFRCLTRITPAQVLAAAERALAERAPTRGPASG
jgi:lipopolysaccharide heptosyltransferase II